MCDTNPPWDYAQNNRRAQDRVDGRLGDIAYDIPQEPLPKKELSFSEHYRLGGSSNGGAPECDVCKKPIPKWEDAIRADDLTRPPERYSTDVLKRLFYASVMLHKSCIPAHILRRYENEGGF